jgi:uncharacterized membrane protein YphA (DoxX/SURF4 family)
MRLLLGALFVFAGVSKLLDPRGFARIISEYGLLPNALLAPVAIGLPALELVAGTCLLFDVRGSLKVTTGLLTVFLIVLGYAILYDLDVECGCFSADEIRAHGVLKLAFARDLGLLAISIYLMIWHRFKRGFRKFDSNQ